MLNEQRKNIDPNKEYWEKAIPWAFTEEKLSYEKKRQMRYELQDYMQKAIPFTEYKHRRVLELGFGSGIDSLEFARNGAIVDSIDFTDNALKIAEQNKKECQQRNFVDVHFQKGDLSEIILPKNMYDLVYSFGVLHHIQDPELIIQKCYDALKPDGKMIVMLYNRMSLLYLYSIEGLRLFTERIDGCPYTICYTAVQAHFLFSRWFREVEVKDYYNVLDFPEKRKVKFYIADSTIKQMLGWHLIIKASK